MTLLFKDHLRHLRIHNQILPELFPVQATAMESEPTVEKMTKPPVVDTKNPDDYEVASSTVIYIEPEKEAAALRKFDKFVLPVSVVFLVLATLDRNNVSKRLCSANPTNYY